jgi:hypothetical protein
VFLVMACDRPEYHAAKHAVARFMLFQKGGAFSAEEFLYDWLAYTANPLCNTFDPSVIAPALGLPELPGFTQNRCEQSVLSNLAVQYGCRLYREACQFGAGSQQDRDIFGDTFFQHGSATYGPDGPGGNGSSFRNVNE